MSIDAFIEAASIGDEKTVRVLLGKNVDVNGKGKDGFTALMSAANRHAKMVKFLLENGADVLTPGINGITPLHCASINGALDCVKILLEKGANVNAARSNDGGTSLMHASGEGYLEIVRLLIGKGANVNAQDLDGCTALAFAAHMGHLSVVQLLIEKGATVNSSALNGVTPLMFASVRGHLGIVAFLLENGADVNAKNKNGDTALHAASTENHSAVVNLLLEKGAAPVKTSSSCFVATVVYGSPNTPELMELRNWRDNTLSRSYFGRHFVDFYYKYGPDAAKIVSKVPALKYVTRVCLDKIVLWVAKV